MPTEIVYLRLIAFLGGFVQGMTGFGVMLFALPLMVLFIDIKSAVPLIILFNRINEHAYRRIIHLFLFALGAMMLVK